VLESRIDRLIHHGDARIIIDLAAWISLSSAGVRVFISAKAKARHENGSIILVSLSAQAEQIMDTCRFAKACHCERLPDALVQCRDTAKF